MRLKEIKPGMVIHCKTEDEAWYLLEHLSKLGFVWLSGCSFLNNTYYGEYGNKTCYAVNENDKYVTFGDFEFYENNGRDIVEFSSLIIEEKTYEDGLNEAWAAAKKIVLRKEHGGLPCEDLERIFERKPEWEVEYSVFKNLAPQEVISRLKSHEHEKYMRENIKVGDVVVNKNNSNVKLLVTAIYGDNFDGIKVGQSDAHGKLGSCYSGSSFGMYERTGTNIGISSILAEIGKE